MKRCIAVFVCGLIFFEQGVWSAPVVAPPAPPVFMPEAAPQTPPITPKPFVPKNPIFRTPFGSGSTAVEGAEAAAGASFAGLAATFLAVLSLGMLVPWGQKDAPESSLSYVRNPPKGLIVFGPTKPEHFMDQARQQERLKTNQNPPGKDEIVNSHPLFKISAVDLVFSETSSHEEELLVDYKEVEEWWKLRWGFQGVKINNFNLALRLPKELMPYSVQLCSRRARVKYDKVVTFTDHPIQKPKGPFVIGAHSLLKQRAIYDRVTGKKKYRQDWIVVRNIRALRVPYPHENDQNYVPMYQWGDPPMREFAWVRDHWLGTPAYQKEIEKLEAEIPSLGNRFEYLLTLIMNHALSPELLHLLLEDKDEPLQLENTVDVIVESLPPDRDYRQILIRKGLHP